MRPAGLILPLDDGKIVPLGAYRTSALSGTMAAGIGANSWVYVFRWTSTTVVAVINEVLIDVAASGTAFTAGFGNFEVKVGRSMTDSGTGGTSLAPTTQKLRASFGAPSVGAIRVATTAALGAPTATFDTHGHANLSVGFPAVAGAQIVAPGTALYKHSGNMHPMIFGTSTAEGFAIRCNVPATGTWQFNVTTDWSEFSLSG